MPDIQHKRGTRADLNTLASSNGLLVGQVYVITDEDRLAVATGVGAYQATAKEGESILAEPFSFVQVRNTSTANINTSAWTNIAFGGTVDENATPVDYTITTDSVTVNFDGAALIEVSISQSSTVARSAVGIQITKNGVVVSGTGSTGYIRALDGHNESSSHASAMVAVVSGDVIRVQGKQFAVAGTVNQIVGESTFFLGRISGGAVGPEGPAGAAGGADVTGDTFTGTIVAEEGVREAAVAMPANDISMNNSGVQTKTLVANTTFTESLVNGDSVLLHLAAGASYTVTWPTMTWVGGAAPTLTADDVLVFWQRDTTVYGHYVGSVV